MKPVKRPRLYAPTYIEPIKSKAPQLGARDDAVLSSRQLGKSTADCRWSVFVAVCATRTNHLGSVARMVLQEARGTLRNYGAPGAIRGLAQICGSSRPSRQRPTPKPRAFAICMRIPSVLAFVYQTSW